MPTKRVFFPFNTKITRKLVSFNNMKKALAIALLLIFNYTLKASHIFGGDLTYSWVSGNTYSLQLVLYADCSSQYAVNSGGGVGTSWNALFNATPVIKVTNGNTLFQYVLLNQVGVATDVTPLCPNQIGQTQCDGQNFPTPGVFKFVYTKNITLNAVSANWKFLFTSYYISGYTGRATTLTNISNNNGGTTMALEATLNNVNGANNSPTFNTIPTPFQCLNTAQNYNPAAVDANNDSLTFSIIPGIDSNYNNPTYIAPATGAQPLTAVAGTFQFNSANGQISYTPSAIQKSVITTKIFEYKNGVLVGSCMREMTFVVLSCNNNPPSGIISNPSIGFIDSNTNIYICQSAPSLSFNINPVDPNNDKIIATVSGLPGNATSGISGNNTSAPIITINWAPSGGFVIGNYNFYINYLDDGCPLASNQTIAYTIHVVPAPIVSTTVVQASCTNGGVGSVSATVTNGNPAYQYAINGGSLGNSNSFSSLSPGNYVISIKDAKNCTASSAITITQPPLPIISAINKTTASCVPGCDGTVTLTASSPIGSALSYNIGTGTFQSANSFSSLCVGSYTFVIKDATGCSISTTVTILNPTTPTFANVSTNFASCNPGCDGSIFNLAGSGNSPFTYKLNAGTYQSATAYTNLCIGVYTLTIKDANSCTSTSTVPIINPLSPTISSAGSTFASCTPGCDGSITNITANSGSATAYTYGVQGGSFQLSNTINNLCVGTYTVIAKDNFGCTGTTVVVIANPNGPVITTALPLTASCAPGCDGGVSSIIASSPNGAIQYSTNGTTFTSNNSINGLCVGTYTLTAKDVAGCIGTSAITVATQPNPVIDSVVMALRASCTPGCDGKIIIYTIPINSVSIFYKLLPSNVTQSNSLFNGVCVGNYTAVVTDSKNCTATASVEMKEFDPPTVTEVALKNVSCYGYTDGEFKIKATSSSGGNVAYLLEPTFTTIPGGILKNLAAGYYNVAVVDGKGCLKDTAILINQPNLFEWYGLIVRNKTCFTEDNGAIQAGTKGGTLPFVFVLQPLGKGNTNGEFLNLASNLYTILATDANGCSISTNVFVDSPKNALRISTTFKEIDCTGTQFDGEAEVFPVGGQAPYSYTWNTDPPQTTPKAIRLFGGPYVVGVLDANGCLERDTVVLRDPTECCNNIIVPNAFTPNSDDKNDFLKIITETNIAFVDFKIYNRWGNVVFASTKNTEGWDAKQLESRGNENNVYFYSLEYTCVVNGKRYFKKGDITLIK